MALEARISDMPIEFHENFQAGISSPVNGCLLTGDPENIEALEPVFVRKYFHETEIFRSEPCFLEVVPMVQYAGLGVAMANAQEKLKHVANYITEHDNDHDGIAEVIEKFF